jgi:hypothetical protein
MLMLQYTYRVSWSEEDKEFVGTCDEFPSLSWLSKSKVEAYDGIHKLVLQIVQLDEKRGYV